MTNAEAASSYRKRNAIRLRDRRAELARQRTPEGKRELKSRGYKYRFGMTLDEIENRIVAQGRVCLVCRRSFDLSNPRGSLAPAVDHDHLCCAGERSCGKCIRGIIHRACNSAIGFMGDDPQLLRLAADYLEGFLWRQRK